MRPRYLMQGALALCAGACLGGCVVIDGGAVEMSWVVRTEDGRAIDGCGCSDPRIDSVELRLVRDDGASRPCEGRKACRFGCGLQTGATPFDIPPGRYAVSLTPLDALGRDLTTPETEPQAVQVPAPILRDVVEGQATDVDVFLIVARCAAGCTGVNKTGVCTSQ